MTSSSLSAVWFKPLILLGVVSLLAFHPQSHFAVGLCLLLTMGAWLLEASRLAGEDAAWNAVGRALARPGTLPFYALMAIGSLTLGLTAPTRLADAKPTASSSARTEAAWRPVAAAKSKLAAASTGGGCGSCGAGSAGCGSGGCGAASGDACGCGSGSSPKKVGMVAAPSPGMAAPAMPQNPFTPNGPRNAAPRPGAALAVKTPQGGTVMPSSSVPAAVPPASIARPVLTGPVVQGQPRGAGGGAPMPRQGSGPAAAAQPPGPAGAAPSSASPASP